MRKKILMADESATVDLAIARDGREAIEMPHSTEQPNEAPQYLSD